MTTYIETVPEVTTEPNAVPTKQRAVRRTLFWLSALAGTAPLLLLAGQTSTDTDSARILSLSRYAYDGHIDYIIDTQRPLLEYLIFGPTAATAGASFPYIVIPLLGTALLALSLSAIVYRLTGKWWAPLTASGLLMAASVVPLQATSLPLYPLVALAGYAGAALTVIYVRWRGAGYLLGAVLAFGVAIHAHGTGLSAVGIAGLFVLGMVASRPHFRRYVIAAAAIGGLVVFTWIIPRVATGGLGQLLNPRVEWTVTSGALEIVNINFWGRKPGGGMASYAIAMVRTLANAVGPSPALILVPALVGLTWIRSQRIRLAAVAAFVGYLLTVLLRQPALFPRFFYILVPGLVLLAALGVHRVHDRLQAKTPVTATLFLVVAIATASIAGINNITDRREAMQAFDAQILSEVTRVAEIVQEGGGGVLGMRAHEVAWVDPTILVYTTSPLTEDEFVTFLSWPDDESVMEVMRTYDARWVLLVKPIETMELAYNDTWLAPLHGLTARHAAALAQSSHFERRFSAGRYLLYEFIG